MKEHKEVALNTALRCLHFAGLHLHPGYWSILASAVR